MAASQSVFDFETGDREVGLVHLYSYYEIPKAAVVYIGQAVDVHRRDLGHLSGNTKFDLAYRPRPKDFRLKILESVADRPHGLIVNARELALIDKYRTWEGFGIGYNVDAGITWKQIAAAHFAGCNCTVDFLEGNGAYASVRECRRWHFKGEHRNWYRHVVYRLHRTREVAIEDVLKSCKPLNKRRTETDVDCDLSKHSVLWFCFEKGIWRARVIPWANAVDESEQIPF